MNDIIESIDRYTINVIKYAVLMNAPVCIETICQLFRRLVIVNQKLWALEDDIRVQGISDEQAGRIGKEIAKFNDERAMWKEQLGVYIGKTINSKKYKT